MVTGHLGAGRSLCTSSTAVESHPAVWQLENRNAALRASHPGQHRWLFYRVWVTWVTQSVIMWRRSHRVIDIAFVSSHRQRPLRQGIASPQERKRSREQDSKGTRRLLDSSFSLDDLTRVWRLEAASTISISMSGTTSPDA
ncbi:hypothetical protein E4U54_001732, partial [Claviceps lovelessii]